MANENRHDPGDLAQFQCLPLEAKIRMTNQRTKAWYESWTRFEIYDTETGKTRFVTMDTREFGAEPTLKDSEWIKSALDGQVYVSFSGGKDSTVLADLCARVCKRYGWTLYLLFVNTGLEYPEIQKFVKTFAEWLRTTYEIEVVLDIVRPEMRFDEVLKKYGYPVVSKEVSNTINGAKNSIRKGVYSHRLCKLGVERNEYGGLFDKGEYDYKKTLEGSVYKQNKWRFLLDADFDASSYCCDIMKKKPSKEYEKQTGRKPFVGTLACESQLRKQQWMQNGCNAFEKGRPTSQPLSFWTEQDILHYIKKYDVPYCSVYGDIVVDFADDFENQMNIIDYLGEYEPEDKLKTTGCDRTGCIFCMFGCHLEKEPNRFQRLKETHPRQYDYCINGGEMVEGKWQPSKEGLGLGHVLDYIGVKYD
jgi:3'-phosphoadenosine 5'-phosphosulfate sulfotransferase (PAPS reductase)/FAD synthetase